MPSLQHLLENIGRNDNLDYLDIYALLKALVEALDESSDSLAQSNSVEFDKVEPEEHTCGKCEYFHSGCTEWCVVQAANARDRACEHFVALVESEDIDATIRKLRKERDTWGRRCKEAEGNLREARAYWNRRCEKVESMLAEAKIADVCEATSQYVLASLSKELAEAKAEIEKLRARNRHLSGELSCLEEECCSLRADARLGELVRGMGSHTQLFRGQVQYWVEQHTENGTTLWVGDETGDVAMALRSIQQKDVRK